MKAMFTGFVAIAVIAVGAHFALENAGFSSQDRNSSSNVRLD
ncbi:hypothetical protein [Psychromarinibacter sp. S121]